jgi:hypothetical protein
VSSANIFARWSFNLNDSCMAIKIPTKLFDFPNGMYKKSKLDSCTSETLGKLHSNSPNPS